MTQDYSALLPYCDTDKQREVLSLVLSHGSVNGAATASGLSRSTIRTHIKALTKKYEARHGNAPMHGFPLPNAPGFVTDYATIQVKGNGEIERTWLKNRFDTTPEEITAAIKKGLESSIKPSKPVKRKQQTESENWMNLYILTDYHLGMMAEKRESGEDWDLEKAEIFLIEWFKLAIERAPNAKTATLAQLGDFMHFDSLEPVTPANKHVLDAGARYHEVVEVAVRVFRVIVQMLLEKYEKVHVVIAAGNHDPAGSVWMKIVLPMFYEKEPRITIDSSPDLFHVVEHGDTSLFFHHGHKRKMTKASNVFVGKFRKAFGRTKYSYGHVGHLHSKALFEDPLMVVEQHRTMAAADAYASSSGFLSGREAQVITYCKYFGDVGRITIKPEMVCVA